MTQDEAKRLLAGHARRPVCGRVVYDANGATLFAGQSGTLARVFQISAIGLSVFAAQGQQSVPDSSHKSTNERCATQVKVLDSSGAVIPGARIVFVEVESAETSKGATDQNGTFRADLRAGKYALNIEAPGFAPYIDHHLILACANAQQAKEVSVTLNLAFVGEIVEVKHYGIVQRLWMRLKSFFARVL